MRRFNPVRWAAFALVISLCLWCLLAMIFFLGRATAQEIILEEPKPVWVFPSMGFDTDQPELPIHRPATRDIRDRIDLGEMEEIIDVGDEWSDDCKIKPDEGELLICRLTW